jgi:hypothetical protein
MLPDLNHSVDVNSRDFVNSCVEKFVNVLKNVADPLFVVLILSEMLSTIEQYIGLV